MSRNTKVNLFANNKFQQILNNAKELKTWDYQKEEQIIH